VTHASAPQKAQAINARAEPFAGQEMAVRGVNQSWKLGSPSTDAEIETCAG
jgi:hypothetical protein